MTCSFRVTDQSEKSERASVYRVWGAYPLAINAAFETVSVGSFNKVESEHHIIKTQSRILNTVSDMIGAVPGSRICAHNTHANSTPFT
jgi:hypothetical protein